MRKRHLPAVKLYRRIRYRKGYGVHSPFVYSFITKVIEEKSPFYAFDEIEKLRKNSVSSHNELNWPKNYGALLFRIANFFKCSAVLQIGGSSGIMSLYLAMASTKHCSCYVLDESSMLLEAVTEFSLSHHLHNLHFITGNSEKNLADLHSSVAKIDLIFINQLPNSMTAEKLFLSCRPLIHKKTVLIINDIIKDKHLNHLWEIIKTDPDVRTTIDLYALGIIFFDDNLPKKQYKTYFNHGKKQNIHKNRRRGLYLISRRKKSSQNESSHRSLRYR